MKLWRVTRRATAWNSIGWDEGPFRIKGGNAIYQCVSYLCGPREAQTVKLSRIGHYFALDTKANGLHQTNRRVAPDTMLEFLEPI